MTRLAGFRFQSKGRGQSPSLYIYRVFFSRGSGFNRFDLGAQQLIARLLHSGFCCSCCCRRCSVAICKIETLPGTPCGSFNQINCVLLLLLLLLFCDTRRVAYKRVATASCSYVNINAQQLSMWHTRTHSLTHMLTDEPKLLPSI